MTETSSRRRFRRSTRATRRKAPPAPRPLRCYAMQDSGGLSDFGWDSNAVDLRRARHAYDRRIEDHADNLPCP